MIVLTRKATPATAEENWNSWSMEERFNALLLTAMLEMGLKNSEADSARFLHLLSSACEEAKSQLYASYEDGLGLDTLPVIAHHLTDEWMSQHTAVGQDVEVVQ